MPKRDNFSTLTHIEAGQRINRWMQGISHEEFLHDELGKAPLCASLKLSGKRRAG